MFDRSSEVVFHHIGSGATLPGSAIAELSRILGEFPAVEAGKVIAICHCPGYFDRSRARISLR
jgi:hypothetical protein